MEKLKNFIDHLESNIEDHIERLSRRVSQLKESTPAQRESLLNQLKSEVDTVLELVKKQETVKDIVEYLEE